MMGFCKSKANFSYNPLSSVNPVIPLEDLPLRGVSKVHYTQESSSSRLDDITRFLSNLNTTLPFLESVYSGRLSF